MSETIDTEVVESNQAVAVRPTMPPPTNLFGASDAVAVVEKATSVASALKDVVKRQGLISNISGKEYPRCEAWTLLGTMLGVYPVCVWTKAVSGGWEARVEARTRDGAIVGAAEAQCLRSERNWSNRDDFALRSMAQTRATAKALRMPLGFVMTLAGYEATPAEEMIVDHPVQAPARPAPIKPAPKPITKPPVLMADERHLTKMIANLHAEVGEPGRDLVTEYFRKLGQLMPNEQIEDLPLRFVPLTKEDMNALAERLAEFERGDEAKPAFSPHTEPAPRLEKPVAPKDDEAWRDVIVPIPRKGQKRDEYLKQPDTIGSLFDLRHGNDDEAAAARQRLFGFVHNYEPKPWKKQDGTEVPPSAADLKFREALDAFADWFEKNHPDEKL